MSQPFAAGNKAFGFCDRCDFRYLLKELKAEVVDMEKTGLLVCEECWDPDHPQNLLGREPVNDPQALKNPRPDNGLISSRFGLLGKVYGFLTGLATSRVADQDKKSYGRILYSNIASLAPNFLMEIYSNLSPSGSLEEIISRTQTSDAGLDSASVRNPSAPNTFTILFPDYDSSSSIQQYAIDIQLNEDVDFSLVTFKFNGELVSFYSQPSRARIVFSDEENSTSLLSSSNTLELIDSGESQNFNYFHIQLMVNYSKSPSVRGPDWEYIYYGLDNISYVGSLQLAEGVPDPTVMTLETSSRNALIKPVPHSGNQLYCIDFNSFAPYLSTLSSTSVTDYKKVEMRIRFLKPSSIGKSDFDGTREWFGQFKWRTGSSDIDENGCSISVSEPDFFNPSKGLDDWITITWESKNADTLGAWENNGDILGWRILLYKYFPTSGTQQPDCFELDYIRFLKV